MSRGENSNEKISMPVQQFNVTFCDAKVRPGVRNWLTNTLESHLAEKGTPDLDDLLAAISVLREQAVSSGLFTEVDGTLKWWTTPTPPYLTGLRQKVRNYLRQKVDNFLIGEALAKEWNEERPVSVELRALQLELKPTLVKDSLNVHTSADTVGSFFVDVKGSKAFVFDEPVLVQGGVRLRNGNYSLPNLYVSILKAIPRSRWGKSSGMLDMLELKADISQGGEGSHSQYVVERTRSLSVWYLKQAIWKCMFGVESIEPILQTRSFLLEPFREFQFQKDRRYYLTSNLTGELSKSKFGVLDLENRISVPLGSDKNDVYVKQSITWRFAKDLWDQVTIRMRANLATAFAPLRPGGGLQFIPLSRRLFAGGHSSPCCPVPLRGFGQGKFGGSRIPYLGFNPHRTVSSEFLGGVVRGGLSCEVGPRNLARCLPARLRERMLGGKWSEFLAENVAPFGFMDSGVLSAKFKERLTPAVTVGVGIGMNWESSRLEGTLAWPVVSQQKNKHCLQFGITLA